MEKLTYYLTPFVIFFVYRIVMCFIELKRNEKERVRKGVFHGVKHIYTEIGLFIGATIGGVLVLMMPRLWPVFTVIGLALCFIGFRLGRKRGIAFDAMLREVALEMQRMETDELTTQEHPAIEENATASDEDVSDAASAEEDDPIHDEKIIPPADEE